MNFEDFLEEAEFLLSQFAMETGRGLEAGGKALASWTAERAKHLASIRGEVGFSEAIRAERDALLMKAGLSAVTQADAMDSRVAGIIQSLLTMGSRLLGVA